MLSITAEMVEGGALRFAAGERTFVNVRETSDGLSPGFRSGELLLMALANCLVGTLLQHQSLREAQVESVVAQLDAHDTPAPRRYERIGVTVTIRGKGLQPLEERLNRVAGACTIGRTLESPVELDVRVRVAEPEDSVIRKGG